MKALGEDPSHGCGRALWENNSENDKYGTTMALMLLPFWTDGCIGSSEGLFFEASGTTPYHFLSCGAMSVQAELEPGAPSCGTTTTTRPSGCSTCRTSGCGTTWPSPTKRSRRRTPSRT